MSAIPVYELKINEANDSFVSAIALVDEPAIESDFIAFQNDQINITFKADDEKMELLGAAMIPDLKIFRRTKQKGDFHVFFSKDTIRKISQVFFKKGLQSQLNLDHTSTSADSYVFQSYIVDKSLGIGSPKGLNLPDGSWVVGVKVDNPDTWKEIKAGTRKGFSVEGLFTFVKHSVLQEDDDDEKEVLDLLEQIKNKLKNKSNR